MRCSKCSGALYHERGAQNVAEHVKCLNCGQHWERPLETLKPLPPKPVFNPSGVSAEVRALRNERDKRSKARRKEIMQARAVAKERTYASN